MTSAISLLMLALSLLTAVQQNPSLPPAFREQAVKIAQTAIVEANKEMAKQSQQTPSTPIPARPENGASAGATMPSMSIEVYALDREEGTIYYRGDKEIQSATVNGAAASIAMSREMPDSCIWLKQPHPLAVAAGTDRVKVCGGYMARVTVPAADSYAVVLTATDGSTAERSI